MSLCKFLNIGDNHEIKVFLSGNFQDPGVALIRTDLATCSSEAVFLDRFIFQPNLTVIVRV